MLFQPSALAYPTPAPFAKKKSAEVERIERLVARLERHVKQAFLRFVETVQSDEVLREVAELLGRGDVESALQVVDRHIARMAPVLSQVFMTAAGAEVTELASQVKSWAPSVGIAFDPTNPRAAELMRQSQLEFIREISASQREAIRQALVQGAEEGAGPREMARVFRSAIGLTARQEEAVRNYERNLRMLSADALDRALRDRRFDRTVERAIDTDEPLSAAQIARMVDAYRRHAVTSRAETIARTETTRVVSAARIEGLRQTIDDAGIGADLVERVWRSSRDHRVRHSHRMMDGQAVGLDEAFTSPSGARLRYPGDPMAPGSETVGCRCIAVNRIRKPERT